MAQSEALFIDFEIDGVWSKCIYSESCLANATGAAHGSTNNSLKAVANYIAACRPAQPLPNANPLAGQHLAATLRYDGFSIGLWLCVRKHNYEKYLWQFVNEGVFNGTKAYQNLNLWTVQLRVRMHRRVPFGCLLRGLQSRLGLRSADSLKFCMDGFYGMLGCGDIFGNHKIDDVPWMEVSNQSTAESLRLQEGDIIFVSYSNEKLEGLARARKRNFMAGVPSAQKGSSSSTAVVVSANNLQLLRRKKQQLVPVRSHNAIPLAGVVQPPSLWRARALSPFIVEVGLVTTHPGQQHCIADERAAPSSQFCLAVIHPSDSEYEPDCVEPGAVFTIDAAELVPDALARLLRLQSELGDLFRVRHPACSSGIGLAMSPDLLTRLLDAASPATDASLTVCPASILMSLQGEARSRVFRFDESLLDEVDADADCRFDDGAGVVDELRRFATELDARLVVQCGARELLPDSTWRVASATDFVVDTFFAAALTSVYGVDREHRFQPYTVDSALHSIDDAFAYTDLFPTAPCDHHLSRAWDLLYLLHPTTRELSVLKPCRHVARIMEHFLRGRKTWQNFVGYSASCLYDDYNAKKAAFWAINYLTAHGTVYQTLLTEIEATLLRAEDGPTEFRRLTLRDIEGMHFLKAFVKEVFRHTSGQFLRFQANASMILQTEALLGFKYRKGSQVGVLLRALNMNPKFFYKPEAFCPQRFLSASEDAGQLCLPFGVMSPRRRIGLFKLKLFLIQLLGRCVLGPHGPAAEVNCRKYGVDVLPPCSGDLDFQFKPREPLKVQ